MSNESTAERNRNNYRLAKDAFNRGDLDTCLSYYAVGHHLRSQDVPAGREHIKAFLESMRATWTDLAIVAEHVVAEGEWVMGRSIATAMHDKPAMGIAPTHRRVETTFWDLHRFTEDGAIAESWNLVDGLAIMRQLSASPAHRES